MLVVVAAEVGSATIAAELPSSQQEHLDAFAIVGGVKCHKRVLWRLV